MSANSKTRKALANPVRALKTRLEKVRRLAHGLDRPSGISVKKLHDIRVACRRAESALDLCKDFLPGKPTRELKLQLKKLRRSCNGSRDCDVMLEWLESQGAGEEAARWQDQLKDDRQSSLPAVARAAEPLTDKASLWQRFKESGKESIESQAAVPAVTERWFRSLGNFTESWLSTSTDPDELHDQRVAIKRLRYATEFVQDVSPRAAFEELVAVLKDLQGHLGEIQDASVRAEQLATQPESGKRGLKKLQKSASHELSQLIRQWRDRRRKSHLDDAVACAVLEIMKLGQ